MLGHRTSFSAKWSDAFLGMLRKEQNARPLKEASLAADLAAWTAHSTTAVVASCQALGWIAAGKGHELQMLPKAGQEYLSIDVMAFNPAAAGESRWPLPIAAFELENSAKDDRVSYSLWKVLCLRTPLRVVFAYRQDWDRARKLVEALAADVIKPLSPQQRMELKGETLVVTGSRGEGETFPYGYFKFWKLDANLGRFEKI